MIEHLSAASIGHPNPAFGSERADAAKNRPFRFAGGQDAFTPVAPVSNPAAASPVTSGNAALLPPQSIVVLVPGMGAPASTMKYLYADFRQRGHHPYVIQVPQVLSARRMADGSAWLSGEIDTIRLMEAKPKLEALQKLFMHPDVSAQSALKQYFKLDDSALGQQTLAVTSRLLMDSGFVQEVLGLAGMPEYSSLASPIIEKLPPGAARDALSLAQNKLSQLSNKPAQLRLARVLEKYRAPFMQSLGVNDPLVAKKITNAVFDKLVPRVALVCHSYGGAVGLKTLQDQSDQHNAIFASYSLSSPVNGMLPNVPYVRTPLEAIYPATGDLMANSPAMQHIRNTAVPEDTTAISLCNPADGTIKPKSTKLNEELPATLNLTVSPRKAGLLSLLDDRMQRVVNAIPILKKGVDKVTGSWMMNDTSTHCGLLVNANELWAPGGELDQRLFNGSEAPAHLARLLAPHNNEAIQQNVLSGLAAYLEKNPLERPRFEPLIPLLQQLAQAGLPFEGSSSQCAQSVLNTLKTPPAQAPNHVPLLREQADLVPA